MPFSRAVFLDRDGVLTKERPDYVKTPDELEVLPGIATALLRLRRMGFRLIVITNQSVIGRGLATQEEMEKIHEKLRWELNKMGAPLDAIYYCPHMPDKGCDCRKPRPGLILKAAKDQDIDLTTSWMVGDKEIDLEAAKRAGCRGLRVKTNKGDLETAVETIINAERKPRSETDS